MKGLGRIFLILSVGIMAAAPVTAAKENDCERQTARDRDEECIQYRRAPTRPLTESTPLRPNAKCPVRRILM